MLNSSKKTLSLSQLQNSMQMPPLQAITHPDLRDKDITLSVLRLDRIHPEIQGNKWFKLRLNLADALEQGFSSVMSFGGVYSNHLVALAAAGSQLGLRTIGVVRGEIAEPNNPVITFLKQHNMRLIALSRSEYRRKQEPSVMSSLLALEGPAYLIPEGGGNALGTKGCEDIAGLLQQGANETENVVVALACGTGTTMAGIINGLERRNLSCSVLGVSVLKAPGYLRAEVANRLNPTPDSSVRWQVSDDFHCGGYAKENAKLRKFLDDFQREQPLPLEHVYTGKLFYGLHSMIQRGDFLPGTRICAIHTGGLLPVR